MLLSWGIEAMEEKRLYETTYIAVPDLTAEELSGIVDKFEGILRDGHAEILNNEKWGLKQLAYPIADRATGKKKQSGYYVHIEFKSPPVFIEKLEREYTYDERILRFLTIAVDKHHAEYNIRRRNRLSHQANLAAAERATRERIGSIDFDDLVAEEI